MAGNDHRHRGTGSNHTPPNSFWHSDCTRGNRGRVLPAERNHDLASSPHTFEQRPHYREGLYIDDVVSRLRIGKPVEFHLF